MEKTVKDANEKRQFYDAPIIYFESVRSGDVITMSADDGDNWTGDDFD